MRTLSAWERIWRVVYSLPVTAAQKRAVTAWGLVHEILRKRGWRRLERRRLVRRKEEISIAVSRPEAIRSRSSLGSSRRDMGDDVKARRDWRLRGLQLSFYIV